MKTRNRVTLHKTEVIRARCEPWLKQKFQFIAEATRLDESDHVRHALIAYAENFKTHVTR